MVSRALTSSDESNTRPILWSPISIWNPVIMTPDSLNCIVISIECPSSGLLTGIEIDPVVRVAKSIVVPSGNSQALDAMQSSKPPSIAVISAASGRPMSISPDDSSSVESSSSSSSAEAFAIDIADCMRNDSPM